MKKFILLLFPIALMGQQGIQFSNLTWEAALAESKKTNKLIFMDAYATWCGPCKALEKYTFTDPSVGAFFNAQFINVRFDMEEYPGIELAEKYNVNLYPTLLFIDGNGELVHRGCGAMEKDEFLNLGKEAVDPTKNLMGLKKAYQTAYSMEVMQKYLQTLSAACQDADAFIAKHFESIPEEKLTEEANWLLIRDYVTDIYSREFLFLLRNQAQFEAKWGTQDVQDKIFDGFMMAYYDQAEAETLNPFTIKSIRYLAEQNGFQKKQELLNFLNFNFGEMTENWALYAKGAVGFIRPEMEDPELLLDVAWKFYLFVDDKENLLAALNWTKYVLDSMEPEPAVIDTYASLLFKLGRKTDAIKYEEQALKLAESWGEDTAHFAFQLAKFQK